MLFAISVAIFSFGVCHTAPPVRSSESIGFLHFFQRIAHFELGKAGEGSGRSAIDDFGEAVGRAGDPALQTAARRRSGQQGYPGINVRQDSRESVCMHAFTQLVGIV